MDGTGRPRFKGDVAIRDGRISALGRIDGRARRTIEVDGLVVCPGFVDTHVHSGHRAAHRLITDHGRPDAHGQPFLEVSVPRKGARKSCDTE